jgi:hypothetical protein
MSHHLDSPTSRKDGRLNITDLYVFDGESGTALVMVSNSSLAGEARTPGFHPEARYEFRVHPDLAPLERIAYRVTFGERDAAGRQTLRVHKLVGDDACDDGAVGTQIAEGPTDTTIDGTGVRVWAGQAADPFYLDFHHLGHVLAGVQNESPIDNGDWDVTRAENSFAGSHVQAIVLEIASSDDGLATGERAGFWADTRLATDAGGWYQTNRAAIPMIWPIFRAIGDQDESPEYQRETVANPVDDLANLGDRVAGLVAAAVSSTGIADPAAYGRVVAERVLPDLLPYRVGTPAAFSFASFNGRRLSDNAPEVMYGLVTNSAQPTGLPAAVAADTRQDVFPYVVPAA